MAVGLAAGWPIAEIRKKLNDPPVEITISLATAYAAFLPAEELGFSGVIAAVTAGIYLGWRAPEVSSAEMRMQGRPVWQLLVFLLNATLFVLIGLQLPIVLDALEGWTPGELTVYALVDLLRRWSASGCSSSTRPPTSSAWSIVASHNGSDAPAGNCA